MDIKISIDKRIEDLELKRKEYIEKGDMPFANQMWARLEELKSLKSKFTDKDGNWK